MCGMNWYREQMEKADEDINRLSELLKMMEERYKLSPTESCDMTGLNTDIIAVYKEIVWRKNSLLTEKSPQA